MFENDTNADDTVSRRSVLKTTGGLLAGGAAMIAGAQHGAATPDRHGPLRLQVREFTEEYIAVDVEISRDEYTQEVEFPNDVFLGHAERFVIDEEGTVSLPEETEGVVANPVDFERINERGEWPKRCVMYFRTEAVDLSQADGEEVTLGLGLFRECTIPEYYWATCPGHRDY